MSIAFVVKDRGTCDRAYVGSVIVKDKRIIATGYNGSPSGLAHCNDVGHLMINGHCVRTIHAEQNALLQAARYGVSVDGSTIYVTHFPCLYCTKSIINAGISRVAYKMSYRSGDDESSIAVIMLKEAGIVIDQVL